MLILLKKLISSFNSIKTWFLAYRIKISEQNGSFSESFLWQRMIKADQFDTYQTSLVLHYLWMIKHIKGSESHPLRNWNFSSSFTSTYGSYYVTLPFLDSGCESIIFLSLMRVDGTNLAMSFVQSILCSWLPHESV